MIVDDELFNIQSLKIIIQGTLKNMKKNETCLDNSIDSVTNGQYALDQFKKSENPYVVIFMDCDMPVMDGYTATKEIREYCSQNKLEQPYIIACTGHSEQRYMQMAWDSGMDELIAKPASVFKMKPILEQFVRFSFVEKE